MIKKSSLIFWLGGVIIYSFKKIFLAVLIVFLLFSITSVSASDSDDFNVQEDKIESDCSQIDYSDSSTSDDVDDVSISNEVLSTNDPALSEPNGEILASEGDDSGNEEDDSGTDGNGSDSANGTGVSEVYSPSIVSSNAEYKSMTVKYTVGNIIYQVKPYDIVNINGTNYFSLLYNVKVSIRVYTGDTYKTYYAYVDEKGIASIKVPHPAVGTHKVMVYVNDKNMGSSSIKVTKSNATVYAPKKTVKRKANSYFYIKLSDFTSALVKNTSIKVNVYTGKKVKTYSVKTNTKGVAKISTSKLALGTHKVIINSTNKNLKVYKSTKIIVKKSVAKGVLKITASAPSKTVKHKANSYFNIKVTDYFGFLKKNLKIKVKVYTGSKYVTYTVKTNSSAIARIKTNKLAIGTHKVVISSGNKNYKLSKSSKIIVNKTLSTGSTSIAPALVATQFYPQGEDYYALVRWKAKNNTNYQVLRKLGSGDYDVLANVKSNSKDMIFYDKIGSDKLYTYSVREILINSSGNILGPYDNEGLKLIDRPNVTVDFQNLKAVVKWTKDSSATKYRVFRKIGRDGAYKCIAIVDAPNLSYVDYYYNSETDLENLLTASVFIDPSYNSLFYTVRACTQKIVNAVTKTSYGLYYADGDFHLESPSIVTLNETTLKWGKVPNAEGYLILKKDEGSDIWEVFDNVTAKTSTIQSLDLSGIEKSAYYAVQSYSTKNGVTVFSDFDKGFSLKNFDPMAFANQRILYFGDSITHGSPYDSAATQHVFSIPYRVAQLLGCVYYNPSIPGSTYHDLGVNDDGSNIENTNYYRYRITREVVEAISEGRYPANCEFLNSKANSEGIENTTVEDYNIVVLAAGTNDYLDNTVLGEENSTDNSTFNGALNYILGKIEESSQNRVAEGKDPIKVVFVDLYYSDRTYNYKQLNNRDTTPNQIGLTLTDYQMELDNQLSKWNESEYLSCYNFNTRDYEIVNQQTCPYVSTDNLHFSKFTYGQYGNAFAQFLLDEVFYA